MGGEKRYSRNKNGSQRDSNINDKRPRYHPILFIYLPIYI